MYNDCIKRVDNKMTKVLGTININVAFDADDIRTWLNNPEASDKDVEAVADILVWNLEDMLSMDGKEVDVFDAEMFNDAYWDMKEELQESYGIVEDEE